jgi:hypothetical protein
VPTRKKISSIHWDSIVRGIDKGLCVPFLGAGVNAGTDLPIGVEVARGLLEKLLDRKVNAWSDLLEVKSKPALKRYPDLARARVQDLARVALHMELEGNYPALVAYLKEIIADENRSPARILHVLAGLPFKLIVTTNYDRLLERAFALEKQPPPLVLSQPIEGFSAQQVDEWQPKLAADERVIYKLHGSFDDPTPNLVISEDDYIDFLGIAADEKLGVPRQIKARIKDSVLLFLGYGLEDWDVRSIYALLIEKARRRERNMSFAIQRNPSPFWVRFWERKDVTIYDLDLQIFAEQLMSEYARRRKGHG